MTTSNEHLLVALAALGGRMDVIATRLDAMESARALARFEQDQWKAEIRGELSEIKEQTILTNGKVQTHSLVLAQMRGVASVFSWWKSALAGAIVAVVVYFVAQ